MKTNVKRIKFENESQLHRTKAQSISSVRATAANLINYNLQFINYKLLFADNMIVFFFHFAMLFFCFYRQLMISVPTVEFAFVSHIQQRTYEMAEQRKETKIKQNEMKQYRLSRRIQKICLKSSFSTHWKVNFMFRHAQLNAQFVTSE